MGLQDPCDWALDICKKKVELWWAGVRNSMASKNQRWKKNRNKLFLWGLGCWHALQNTWTWKKTPLVFSYYLFSRCTIPIWNAQLLWKLGLTLHLLSAGFHQIYTSFDRLSRLPLAFEQKDFWHFSFWKLQVGTALEICIQVRKISWIFVSFWKLPDQVVRWPGGPGGPGERGGPGGQVTRRSGCAFKRKSHFCWMASMASPPFGKL